MCVYCDISSRARATEDAIAIASFARTLHALSRSSFAGGNLMNERSEQRALLSRFFFLFDRTTRFFRGGITKSYEVHSCAYRHVTWIRVNWNISSRGKIDFCDPTTKLALLLYVCNIKPGSELLKLPRIF